MGYKQSSVLPSIIAKRDRKLEKSKRRLLRKTTQIKVNLEIFQIEEVLKQFKHFQIFLTMPIYDSMEYFTLREPFCNIRNEIL